MASYTPQSKSYADRLILDYTVMRSAGTLEAIAAANWWLSGKLATLHTKAMAHDLRALSPEGADAQ